MRRTTQRINIILIYQSGNAKSTINGGFMWEHHRWWIFHCHAWLPNWWYCSTNTRLGVTCFHYDYAFQIARTTSQIWGVACQQTYWSCMHVTVYAYDYCIYYVHEQICIITGNKTHMPIQQLNTPAGRQERKVKESEETSTNGWANPWGIPYHNNIALIPQVFYGMVLSGSINISVIHVHQGQHIYIMYIYICIYTYMYIYV